MSGLNWVTKGSQPDPCLSYLSLINDDDDDNDEIMKHHDTNILFLACMNE